MKSTNRTEKRMFEVVDLVCTTGKFGCQPIVY